MNGKMASPVGCSHLKLRRLTRLVSRHYDSYLINCGLKTTQYSLLSTVVTLGPLAPVEIAGHLSVDASTLTRNLRPLLDAGLLAQSAGPDARSRRVAATPAGREKQREARAFWKRAQQDFNGRIGPDRVNALHELVESCRTLLEGKGHDVKRDPTHMRSKI